MSGIKHDKDKPDLSLLPYPALVALARALMYGEKKYARHNFREGFNTNRLVAAALRHVHQWNEGEDLDPESGVSHLGHALAALSMLITNLEEGTATDGRYKEKLTEAEKMAKLEIERLVSQKKKYEVD